MNLQANSKNLRMISQQNLNCKQIQCYFISHLRNKYFKFFEGDQENGRNNNRIQCS